MGRDGAETILNAIFTIASAFKETKHLFLLVATRFLHKFIKISIETSSTLNYKYRYSTQQYK